MSSIVEKVSEVVEPITTEMHYELVDIEYVKEGKNWFLRVYIDKPSGITLEDCAEVSEKVSEKLDQIKPDPFPHAYFLEVSSPGAERPLKKEEDYQNALGKTINISLYEPVEGEKIYEGVLEEITESSLTLSIRIKTRTKEMTFDRKKIAKARLAIVF
ncbi:ribosome maturation factor RimP [Pisciglobus halotolerans]|uniref:Ribosome maturation factor RimP n=1 Tax=Pisciglobus halotolerans TaxID=745365 RepID=A0A1I3BYV4_9LACT|nr:ribosome maturation factor RimP [Pisciglobus halotolerans]SFH67487.1 ribosome maturation factor RimP [Pisciglobus halotolerans]